MQFDAPLIEGTLIQRYKRFLCDVRLDDGTALTAVCPNTGSMRTCIEPGWRVGLSHSDNPKRKYAHTWEVVHNGQCWIGINTARPNAIVAEAIAAESIPELAGYDELKREQKYGKASRIDILLRSGEKRCYVEVKNTTMLAEDGRYAFPDSVTTRGLKHLVELSDMVREGHRAVMVYLVQRSDGDGFRAAHEIDPDYAAGLSDAIDAGVELLAYRTDVTLTGITLAERVPVVG